MFQPSCCCSALTALALLLAPDGELPLHAADYDPYDQSAVPLEVEPKDPKLAKIVLLAGKPSHKPGEHEFFAGSALLVQLLQQTPGVFPTLARDGWPKDPKLLEGARCVVLFMDGGGEQSILQRDRLTEIQKWMDAGVGIVHLHAVIDYPKDLGDRVLGWLGGFWEPKFSRRAHWVAEFKEFPEHPITRGVQPFKIDDGWLYNIRFVPELRRVTPLLRTAPPNVKALPGNDAIVCWGYERPNGGRAFVFTGGHLHSSWGQEGYRRLLVNGILWAAQVDVPRAGAPVQLDPTALNKNLDRKGPGQSR